MLKFPTTHQHIVIDYCPKIATLQTVMNLRRFDMMAMMMSTRRGPVRSHAMPRLGS